MATTKTEIASDDVLVERLRERGLRATSQRLIMHRLLRERKPDELVHCFDDDWKPQPRVDAYDGYKSERVQEPPELSRQFELLDRFLVAAGMFVLSTVFIVLIERQPIDHHDPEAPPLRLIHNQSFVILMGVLAFAIFAMYLAQPLTPNFLEGVRGLSLSEAGIIFTAGALGNSMMAILLSRVHPRFGFLFAQGLVILFAFLIWKGSSLPIYALDNALVPKHLSLLCRSGFGCSLLVFFETTDTLKRAGEFFVQPVHRICQTVCLGLDAVMLCPAERTSGNLNIDLVWGDRTISVATVLLCKLDRVVDRGKSLLMMSQGGYVLP